MKKIITLLVLLLLFSFELSAQKLVIGSEVDDHKKIESVKWLSAPQSKSSVWIIDFYASSNPTAAEFYNNNISRIKATTSGRAEIVVITSKSTPEFEALAESDGNSYAFAVDTKGEFHKLLGVRYIPFTVIVNNKGKILWQGNLSTLTDKVIDQVL